VDLLHELRRRLSPKVALIHEWRSQGRSWAEIARELHELP
jgi:hypothetical protein